MDLKSYIFDVISQYIREHAALITEEKQIKDAISAFLESQKDYHEFASLEEELDFQGLSEFIINKLQEVDTRVFDPNNKKRGNARESIIASAIEASSANSDAARDKVAYIVRNILDILREIYRKGILKKEMILASDIVDSTVDQVSIKLTSDKNEIIKEMHTLGSKITDNHESGQIISLDNLQKAIDCGEYEYVEKQFQNLSDHLSVIHPLKDFYRAEYNQGMIVSVPISPQAEEKYPQRWHLTGPIRIGDKYVNDPQLDILDFARRHQLETVIEVQDASITLGEQLDPFQGIIKDLIGKEVHITPPPLSKTFPCKIMSGDDVYFDYILLKTQEILDDGTLVLGNDDQEIHFHIRINIPCNKTALPSFNVKVNNKTNRDAYRSACFHQALLKTGHLSIVSLENQQTIISGTIAMREDADIKELDEEVAFYEALCTLEEYYKVTIPQPQKVTYRDYNYAIYLSALITNEAITSDLKCLSLKLNVCDEVRQLFDGESSELVNRFYTADYNIEILGMSFKFNMTRYIPHGIISNYDKVKKLLPLLDESDDIKVVIETDDENPFVDSLIAPE